MSKNFWVDQTRKMREKIIRDSFNIDYNKEWFNLDYDDDTEICGYHEDGAKYGVWLAVYDGVLEWTLDEYEGDNSWENIACSIWDTRTELNGKVPTDEELEEICKQKLQELIKEYGRD